MNRTTRILAAVVASAALAACTSSESTDTDTDSTAEPAAAPGSEAESEAPQAADSVEITGVDYGFEGFPETLAVGTELTFTNGSDAEYHEMAVMRINDDETRSVDELLALGDEAMASMTFVGVAAAAPGEDGTVIDGDLTLTEAGRYVATCFIPVGADPEVVEKAFSGGGEQDGPPDLGDGAPHAMEGMIAEFVVE